jgi:hypothetical protein
LRWGLLNYSPWGSWALKFVPRTHMVLLLCVQWKQWVPLVSPFWELELEVGRMFFLLLHIVVFCAWSFSGVALL